MGDTQDLEATVERLERLAASGITTLANGMETLSQNNAKFDERLSGLSQTVSDLQAFLPSINRFNTIMEGNGGQGLPARMALLENEMQRIRDGQKEDRQKRWQVYVAMVGAGIAIVLPLILRVLNMASQVPKP